MGGGSEYPVASGSKSKEIILAVLPWPESASASIIKEIKEEYPQYDFHYVAEQYTEDKSKRGKVTVPADLYRRATIIATLDWLPADASEIPNCELIQFFSAGTNHVVKHPIYTDSKIPLATASGVHGPQIAEWVIMMSLVHSHSYLPMYEAQKKKEWMQKRGLAVRDAVGRKVGILGYGSIGRQVARVALNMGSTIVAYTASPRPTPDSKRDTGFIVPGTGDPDGEFPSAWYSGLDKQSLHEFLGQGLDLLVCSVPLTKDTMHFLSTPEFEVLHKANPNGTFIANISRGGIIDQPALIEALENKKINGAALDVTDPEPLPKNDPLWDAPNVLITPHVSGSTTVYAERAFRVLREQLRRRKEGEKLVNIVDRKRGY